MTRTKSEKIKAKALELGFLSCGISEADFLSDEKDALQKWLQQGMHGEMSYMEHNQEMRLDPRLIFEGARSVISVLLNYYPKKEQQDAEAPVLSKYAYGKDYHFVLKEKLNLLLKYIQEEIAPCNGRPFVDSAPVLDKAWAAKAGLGWIGKHSNLISVEHGSFFFIGELIVDLPLKPDQKTVRDHCGTCTRCIDACPTQAIVAPGIVDARRCISYQTIELRGELDDKLKDQFKNRVFGCDICQDVCPWNLKSEPHQEPDFEPHPQLLELTRKEWMDIDHALFNELFRKSAVKRTKYDGLKRNLRFLDDQ
ncbi:tRNA epoxyqueuosine(34) reductase QueG [Sunxiuqinia elliptica]|uniref:Epoxyqueuosine reductase n=1 Tax=Sunxiuqinia elliptica TaxID=655355 RepID=A0A4R6H5F5_9BACT|nr:tRNA epoxyqueuosine(34) reductase QueG [Sunxiuqinia elliptica]TDO03380.1 epoxyqueuosine reductase [Sunxiuqinia elliptica]TDO59577.1 epoxyqueuosine reductase [Sunxiuqinia elliptica]